MILKFGLQENLANVAIAGVQVGANKCPSHSQVYLIDKLVK